MYIYAYIHTYKQFRVQFSGVQDELSVQIWDWEKYKYDGRYVYMFSHRICICPNPISALIAHLLHQKTARETVCMYVCMYICIYVYMYIVI